VTITLFTSPEPLVAGAADLSVLVQDADSNEPLSRAHVEGSLTSARTAIPLAFAASGTMMAATLHLPTSGSYRLDLFVESPGAPPAVFTTTLIVEASHERRTMVILAVLFPLAVIALFLVNQQLKANRRIPT
jgi:hypothetical protein